MSQRVVITAGASGIGLAMAKAFLNAGAQVAILDVDDAALANAAAAHLGVLAIHANVTDETALASAFAQVDQALGGVDVVCANAGTGGPAGRLEEIEADAWRDCVDVNLTGAFLTCKQAAKRMRVQKSGSIILTSSTAGLFGYPYRSPYAAAKWAIVGLAKTLAMELGEDGIRVNAIAPGSVEGRRMEHVLAIEAEAKGLPIEEVRAQYVKGVSMKTWVSADDIANMAVFLASEQGAKISGQVMAVDGHTETLAP